MKTNFFKSYLFYGIITVLVAVIIQTVILPLIENNFFHLICEIIGTAVTTMGVGLIIGYVIDFTQNSKNYINYIRERLKDIIVSKDFYNILSDEHKKEIINSFESDSFSMQEILSHILKNDELKDYKKEKINSIININDINNDEYFDNVKYNVSAKIVDGRVVIYTKATYTVHTLNNIKLKPIKLRFNTDKPFLKKITFTDPEDPNKDIVKTNFEKYEWKEVKAHKDGLINEMLIPIPEIFQEYKVLTITKEFESIEHDHWATYSILFDHITKGIDFDLNIEDNSLIIKNVVIFEKTNLYAKDQKDKSLIIKSNQWLSRYSGFHILIAKKN